MIHLRQYIRQILLTEAAKTPGMLPDHVVVVIRSTGVADGETIYYGDKENPEEAIATAKSRPLNRAWMGHIEIRPMLESEGMGPCAEAWKVSWSKAQSGWGPMLYDVAMEYATIHGNGLMPDRDSVSDDAENVWWHYLNSRGDVSSYQLDNLENVLTPDIKEDNCDQGVAKGRTKGSMGWVDSWLSKRYTKAPTTIDKLRALGKLVIL